MYCEDLTQKLKVLYWMKMLDQMMWNLGRRVRFKNFRFILRTLSRHWGRSVNVILVGLMLYSQMLHLVLQCFFWQPAKALKIPCVCCIQSRIIRGVVSFKVKYKPVRRLTPWIEIPHLNFLEIAKCNCPQAVVIFPLSFQTDHKNIYIYIHCTDGTL